MKLVKGVYLPDSECHLEQWAKEENWRYQGEKLDAAMKYVRKWDVAIDVGAHCGLWSKELSKKFAMVVGFEPLAEHRECYERNVKGKYFLHPYALGNEEKSVRIKTNPESTGCSKVHPEGDVEVQVKRLDDLYQGPCDFLKVDCEGYEEFVLRGALSLLLENKPAMIVEQKPNNGNFYGLHTVGAVSYLKTLGAKLREVIKGDYIMSWDE
jgi:FkbM family methyltransferase